MIIEPLGDSAYLLRDLSAPADVIASRIERSRSAAGGSGILEVVASYETVGVYVDPDVFDPDSLHEAASGEIGISEEPKRHVIPVCYEFGEDLIEVAGTLGKSVEEVVHLHTASPYRCFAVGFCPGFPYLGYLPDEMAGLPRLASPRVRVEPGSVAITGRQTGVYPLARPGGWWILGRTPLTLVDPDDDYFPIRAGDEVRFEAIPSSEYEARVGERL